MGYINWIFLASFVMATALELNQLNMGVWLSGAAYCGKEQYKTMKITGPAKGFVYKDTLYDEKTDLQGYVGTLSSTKTIYVVFRGSSSTMNWLDDFEVKLVPYTMLFYLRRPRIPPYNYDGTPVRLSAAREGPNPYCEWFYNTRLKLC